MPLKGDGIVVVNFFLAGQAEFRRVAPLCKSLHRGYVEPGRLRVSLRPRKPPTAARPGPRTAPHRSLVHQSRSSRASEVAHSLVRLGV